MQPSTDSSLYVSLCQVWDIRTEPGVVGAFAKIWGTDKLVTSFDAGSIMLPKRTDVKDSGKCQYLLGCLSAT